MSQGLALQGNWTLEVMTGSPPEAEDFFRQKISRNEHLDLASLGGKKEICGGPNYF